jgi:hypothetical protein
LARRLAAQEHGERAQLFRRNELHRRLFLGEEAGFRIFGRYFLRGDAGVELLLDHRRQHPARADRVAGDAGGRGLEGDHLGQPH